MTSRLTSEVRMPSAPIVMPSETAMVLNSIGVPPASRTPSFTFSARRRRWKLHGPISVHVLAMPTSGLCRSSSVKPTGLEHRARRGAARAFGQGCALVLGIQVVTRRLLPRARPGRGRAANGPARGYEPRTSATARTRRGAPGRDRSASSAPDREVEVEQVFPGAAGRPRFELGEVDAAQREDAEGLEQRPGLVGQREDHRRLVAGRSPMNSATAPARSRPGSA